MLVALCFLSAASFSQEVMNPTGPDASYAPCLEGQKGSRFYESPILTSPDGLWRARASVEAEADGKRGWCSNTSTLLVQGPDHSDYRPVYVEKPTSDLLGNSLKLIAWSSQGHLLAIANLQFQYGSDVGGFSPLIYDADQNRVIEPELEKLFAAKFHKKNCAVSFGEVLGFDSRSRLLFEAGDWYGYAPEEGEQPDPQTRCLGSPGVWALDLRANSLELVRSLEDSTAQPLSGTSLPAH